MKELAALIDKDNYDNDTINKIIDGIIEFIKINTESGIYQVIKDETYNREVIEKFHNKMPISYELYYDNELVSGSFNYYIEDNKKYSAYISGGKRILFLQDNENHIFDKWIAE